MEPDYKIHSEGFIFFKVIATLKNELAEKALLGVVLLDRPKIPVKQQSVKQLSQVEISWSTTIKGTLRKIYTMQQVEFLTIIHLTTGITSG